MLNRSVLIVRPRQPYIDWAAQLDDSGVVPDPEDEKTVYLIPEFESDDEAWGILEGVYTEVFERERRTTSIVRTGPPFTKTLGVTSPDQRYSSRSSTKRRHL